MLHYPLPPERPAVLIECDRLGCATNTAGQSPTRFNKGTDCARSGSPAQDHGVEPRAVGWGSCRSTGRAPPHLRLGGAKNTKNQSAAAITPR